LRDRPGHGALYPTTGHRHSGRPPGHRLSVPGTSLRHRHPDRLLDPGGDGHPVHRRDHARRVRNRPARVQGIRLWRGLHDVGGDALHRHPLHQGVRRRRHHAGPRPRPGGDDGGDLRHRQHQPDHVVAVRPGQHHRLAGGAGVSGKPVGHPATVVAAGPRLHPVRDFIYCAGDFALHAAAEVEDMSATTASVQTVPGPAKDERVAAALGRRRRLSNTIVKVVCVLATVIGLALLASILFTLLYRGLGGVSLTVFTTSTLPPGSGGGLLNAIIGSLIQTLLGAAIGTPIGLMVGTYLAEYAQGSVVGNAVRFVSDVLLSAPSILIGLFIYEIAVSPFGGFSGFAGCLALAVIVVPIVVRTTEDMLRLIPSTLREAVIGLGAPKWKMIVLVCYRAARQGIATGILLAVARIAGETAPLLFTSLGNLN